MPPKAKPTEPRTKIIASLTKNQLTVTGMEKEGATASTEEGEGQSRASPTSATLRGLRSRPPGPSTGAAGGAPDAIPSGGGRDAPTPKPTPTPPSPQAPAPVQAPTAGAHAPTQVEVAPAPTPAQAPPMTSTISVPEPRTADASQSKSVTSANHGTESGDRRKVDDQSCDREDEEEDVEEDQEDEEEEEAREEEEEAQEEEEDDDDQEAGFVIDEEQTTRAKRMRCAGLDSSDESDDEDDDEEGHSASRPRTMQRLARGNRQSDEDEDDSADDDRVELNAMGRVIRTAAKAAMVQMAKSDWKQWGSAKKRRVRSGGESKTEEDDPGDVGWTEELLNRLVDKKTEDGVVFYRAEWAEYQDEERYTWEPVENLKGHEEWMALVDLWKAKYEGTKTFASFVKNNATAIRLGDGDEMKCFFFAIEAVRKLLKLDNFDLDAVITKLTSKGWDFAGGVKKTAVQHLVQALTSSGLKLDHKVWHENLHKTEFGPRDIGIVASLREGPGVYMVATMDPRRVGHCWVIVKDEDDMLEAYDNGAKVEFSAIRFGEILWVRHCVPFVMRPRQRKRKKTQ